MNLNKKLMTAFTKDFSDFNIVDWIQLALGILALLRELLQSDGNGGVKLKDGE